MSWDCQSTHLPKLNHGVGTHRQFSSPRSLTLFSTIASTSLSLVTSAMATVDFRPIFLISSATSLQPFSFAETSLTQIFDHCGVSQLFHSSWIRFRSVAGVHVHRIHHWQGGERWHGQCLGRSLLRLPSCCLRGYVRREAVLCLMVVFVEVELSWTYPILLCEMLEETDRSVLLNGKKFEY